MPQKIKSIHFGKDSTTIGFVESYKPRDSNKVANEQTPGRIFDLPRHADFERAMDKLKPHLLIISEFQKPVDVNGNYLQKSHFDNFFADEDEESERFGGLTITGILLQGKNASDGVQLIGTKTTSYGEVVKFKTPSVALKRVPDGGGYNYPLIEILDTHVDTLIHEAEEYLQRKKHGAGVQSEIDYKRNETEDHVSDEVPVDELDKVIKAKSKGAAKKQLSLAEVSE